MSERALSPDSIRNMAQKVAFVSFDVIQFRDKEMRSHWYRYEEIDLYYFQTHLGDVAKIHLTVFGQVVEWNPFDGVRTGLLIEQEGDGGVTEIVQYDSCVHKPSLDQALDILNHALKIEAPQRQKLMNLLSGKQAAGKSWLQKVKRALKKRGPR